MLGIIHHYVDCYGKQQLFGIHCSVIFVQIIMSPPSQYCFLKFSVSHFVLQSSDHISEHLYSIYQDFQTACGNTDYSQTFIIRTSISIFRGPRLYAVFSPKIYFQPGRPWTFRICIFEMSKAYQAGSRTCYLCLSEKYHIISSKNNINKKSELISKCRFEQKFLLKSFTC